MAKNICSVEGCEKFVDGQGLCHTHYANYMRNGIIVPLARMSPVDRFLSKVNSDGPTMPHMDTPCHVWTAGCVRFGYGRFVDRSKGKNYIVLAHRWSWETFVSAIPNDLHVLHKCDNPPCVNPDHLFLGTEGDNTADKMEKDRQPRGERIVWSKLTDHTVMEIRRRSAAGELPQDLAQDFGVSPTNIRHVVARRTWTHLP